jgi:hypothetical protein
VLRIRDVYPGSLIVIFFQYLNRYGTKKWEPIDKKDKYFLSKKFLLSEIRDSGKNSVIPDPDPGSQIRIPDLDDTMCINQA